VYNTLELLKPGGSAMAIELNDDGARRTRRNIMKMGAILAPATLLKVSSASAGGLGCNTILAPVLPWCGDPSPGKGGPTGNCFLKGTSIRAAEGERKVEDLAIGDLVPTVFGGARPIQWIGRYTLRKSDPSKPWARDARPVRIARSALGPDAPHSDLYVTAAHSLLIDGVLVPAEMLVNGVTVTRHEPEGDELEFFHIKLESHDVVYAEGAPAETLAQVDESFANFVDYLRRYGMPATEEGRCAPLVRIGGRAELMSRFRSALSPLIDLRGKADVVRDRLEERGIASL
jgi:Hint domain